MIRVVGYCVSRHSGSSYTINVRKTIVLGRKARIATDFSMGGIIARSYWNGFLDNFDPAMVLEESRWEMGKIKGKQAEIIITYQSAERPAILRMYKEDDRWKVGLVETFWSRR